MDFIWIANDLKLLYADTEDHLKILYADTEDPVQAARISRVIRVFAQRIRYFVDSVVSKYQIISRKLKQLIRYFMYKILNSMNPIRIRQLAILML